MIKIKLINTKGTIVKTFKDIDEFLKWYFEDDNNYMIDRIIEGKLIIKSEIKQKGINNK